MLQISMLLTLCLVSLAKISVAAAPSLVDASIEDIQTMMTNEDVSSVDLVNWYLARIETYDKNGPNLNSIKYSNPLALAQAKAPRDWNA